MAYLSISLLGHFEVKLDGQLLTHFKTDKTRALLAYLVVEIEREHRRAQLAGLLWPEQNNAAAHHNLSQTLLRLRQALADPSADSAFLLGTRQTLRFNPGSHYTLDVEDFQASVSACAHIAPAQIKPEMAQALAAALKLYRGKFLSDPWAVDSFAFEEWLTLQQSHYHLMALDACEYLTQYHSQRGAYALAARYARQNLSLEPLREPAHRQLIQSLALDGRRSEALRSYAEYRALVKRELGVEPTSETQALYEKIRDHSLAAPAPPQIWPAADPVPQIASPPFVGRAPELDRLSNALASSLTGAGQLRFITGEAGSGKSALLHAFAQRAGFLSNDLLVVSGRGSAYTGLGEPYWPFIEIFQQLLGDAAAEIQLPAGQVQRLTAAREIIYRLLKHRCPSLVDLFSPGEMETPAQIGLFAVLMQALSVIAEDYPLVLLLDDLQWADRDSLNLLFHLGPRLAQLRILIVGAFRLEALRPETDPLAYMKAQNIEQPHPLAAIFYELQRSLGEIQIDLQQAPGQDFIAALLDSEPNHLDLTFRATLYAHTGGHALFTTELLRGLQERGDLRRDPQGFWVQGKQIAWHKLPARVEGSIAARMGQLLPDWQTILAYASVEGDEFTVQVLAEMLDLPATEISRRLSGALSRHHHFVVPVGVQMVGGEPLARYRFQHLLYQRYVYNQLDIVERAQLHLRVGTILEKLYAENVSEIGVSLARHFELGGAKQKAVVYLLQAGQHAAQLGATEEALQLLTHGLGLLEGVENSSDARQLERELQFTLGSALLVQGWATSERTQVLERAYELCRQAGDPQQLARGLLLLADANLARGQLDQAQSVGAQLHLVAQSTHEPLAEALAAYVLGNVAFFQGELSTARQYLEDFAERYEPHDQKLSTITRVNIGVSSGVWLAQTLWVLGYPAQALQRSQQAIELARDLEQPVSLGLALSIGELKIQHFRGEVSGVQAALQQISDLSRNVPLGIFQIWANLYQGWIAASVEHDLAGLAQIQQAIQQWAATGALGGRAYQYLVLVEAHLALDQAAAACVVLDEILAQISVSGFLFCEAEFLRLKGDALDQLGCQDEAETCYLNAIARAQAQAAKTWELRALTSLGLLRQSHGDCSGLETVRLQLAEVVAWFSEGPVTVDLQAAVSLMG